MTANDRNSNTEKNFSHYTSQERDGKGCAPMSKKGSCQCSVWITPMHLSWQTKYIRAISIRRVQLIFLSFPLWLQKIRWLDGMCYLVKRCWWEYIGLNLHTRFPRNRGKCLGSETASNVLAPDCCRVNQTEQRKVLQACDVPLLA